MDSKRKSEEYFTRSKMKKRKIQLQNSQTFSIGTIFDRFPKLTEDILGCLDKKTLANSVLVNKTWRNVILNQRPYHIQYIRNWTEDCHGFNKEWKEILKKIPFKLLKKLSSYTKPTKKRLAENCMCSCNSPIHFAALYGDSDLFQYLEVKTENKNPSNIYGQTPLHFAAMGSRKSQVKGYLDICKWYFGNGIYVNEIKDNGESTPLHYAVKSDNIDLFKYLFENGADLYSNNIHGQTVLHRAAIHSSIQIASFIVMHYKVEDISTRDIDGMTPMFHAIKQKSLDMVKLLFKSGGHFNTKTDLGDTPIHYAIDLDGKLAEFILINVFDKNPPNDMGDTPLHDAAERGFMNICVAICKYIPIEERNPKNNAGQTPIDLACQNQHWEILYFLMKENNFVNCHK